MRERTAPRARVRAGPANARNASGARGSKRERPAQLDTDAAANDVALKIAVLLEAECGGAGVCATCHVRIPLSWQDSLPPPSDEELARLDEIADADETSRLACQIVMTDELDGLELELQPDSLIAQTYWVAG